VRAVDAACATRWSGLSAARAPGHDVDSRTGLPSPAKRGRLVYRPATGALDRPGQQAPGFCAQKSSNCCAFEPLGGAVLLAVLSLGAAVPPPVLPVVVPVLPVGVLVAVGVAVGDVVVVEESLLEVLVPVLELSPLAAAASAGDVLETGTETSAGGPGTCMAAESPPPQPAAARASRPVATSAMMRPGMWLTPP
jgi:hypothetical protein